MALIGRCTQRSLAKLISAGRIRPILRLTGAKINTTSKDKDHSVVPTVDEEMMKKYPLADFDARITREEWISWGFDKEDREMDRTMGHLTFFLTITMVFCGVGYFIFYHPRTGFRDWAQREAYLQIRRREELGLPHVDRNLVPVDRINLPTDEELGDTEIII